MNLIRNVRVISPDIDYKYANIILDGEYIKSVTEKEVNPENFDRIIEGEGLMALPGFIDEHTHGAVGYDVCDGKYESIDKIAEDCGFNSSALFRRTFRKVTGMSPSEYRSIQHS